MPLDKVLVNRLADYGIPKLSCAWSRIDDYDEYLEYQSLVRKRFKLAPLEIEFLLWLGRSVDRWTYVREP